MGKVIELDLCVCLCGFVRGTLCTTPMVQDFVVHHLFCMFIISSVCEYDVVSLALCVSIHHGKRTVHEWDARGM